MNPSLSLRMLLVLTPLILAVRNMERAFVLGTSVILAIWVSELIYLLVMRIRSSWGPWCQRIAAVLTLGLLASYGPVLWPDLWAGLAPLFPFTFISAAILIRFSAQETLATRSRMWLIYEGALLIIGRVSSWEMFSGRVTTGFVWIGLLALTLSVLYPAKVRETAERMGMVFLFLVLALAAIFPVKYALKMVDLLHLFPWVYILFLFAFRTFALKQLPVFKSKFKNPPDFYLVAGLWVVFLWQALNVEQPIFDAVWICLFTTSLFLILAGMRSRLELASTPEWFRGVPVFITAGIIFLLLLSGLQRSVLTVSRMADKNPVSSLAS